MSEGRLTENLAERPEKWKLSGTLGDVQLARDLYAPSGLHSPRKPSRSLLRRTVYGRLEAAAIQAARGSTGVAADSPGCSSTTAIRASVIAGRRISRS